MLLLLQRSTQTSPEVGLLLTLAIFLVVGGLIAYGAVQSARRKQALQTLAQTHGWTWIATQPAQQIHPLLRRQVQYGVEGVTDGVAWRLEIVTTRETNVMAVSTSSRSRTSARTHLRWVTTDARFPGMVLLMAPVNLQLLFNPLVKTLVGDKLVNDTVNLMMMTDVTTHHDMQEATVEGLSGVSLLTPDPASAASVVTPAVQRALEDWRVRHPGSGDLPAVLLYPDGVALRVENEVVGLSMVEDLAAFGAALARAAR